MTLALLGGAVHIEKNKFESIVTCQTADVSLMSFGSQYQLYSFTNFDYYDPVLQLRNINNLIET